MTEAAPRPADYPHRTFDKLRYSDTDRQGHVNNAVFATFLETGRVDLLFDRDRGVPGPDMEFVLASVSLSYLAEVTYPGEVWIGTRIARIGNSSIGLSQGLFQNDTLVATAESTVVQVSNVTHRSAPFTEPGLTYLRSLQ